MAKTKHAAKRLQQRAIPECMITLLHLYGEEVEQKGGTSTLYMDDRGYKAMRRDMERVMAHLDSLKDTYLVEAEDGTVITVGHKYQRLTRK